MRRPTKFGKYLLLGRISVGGMAEVFKAKSFGVQGFEKIIAIKRILPSLGRDEDFITMFIDEAKIAGQLAHANIGQIHELGQVDGAHFIAMEYIWGRDLLQLQNRFKKRGKKISRSAASFIVMKVCEGLHYAHKKRDVLGAAMQIVHRDCSPQNIVISFEGEVKLIDFGIARAASRSSRTNAGVLKGKFGYMSPEQVRGLPLDRRSDIFSLGIILFEILTGKRLFDGESDFSTLEKVRNVEIDHQVLHDAQVPEPLKAIVLKALARSPDERYQWCSEMRDDIRVYLQSIEEAYSYRSLGEEIRAVFADELVREKELMDLYSQIGPEGLPPEEESVERLVGFDDPDLGESSDESVLDSLDFIETSEPLGRPSSGGVDGFEDNPTEIFGEIEMGEIMNDMLGSQEPDAAANTSERVPTDPVGAPETVDVADLIGESFDRGLSQPLVGGEDGAKVTVDNQRKPKVPSASALVASLPTLEGSRNSNGGGHGQQNPMHGISTPPPAGPGISGEYPAHARESGVMPQGNFSQDMMSAAMPAIPSTGVRARPVRNNTRRNIIVGVGAAVVALLAVVLGRGMLFPSDSDASAQGPRATLVVLVDDKESAEVFLGEDSVGNVPAGDALTVDALKPGTYDIRVARDGFAGCSESITVTAAKAKVFTCDFGATEQGTLVIEDLLPGDHVVIDGKAVPTALLKNPIALAAGRSHMVAVTRSGELVDEFEVSVEVDKESRHQATPDAKATGDAGVDAMTLKTDELASESSAAKDDAEAVPSTAKTVDPPVKVVKATNPPVAKPVLKDRTPERPVKKPQPAVVATKDPEEPAATGPGYLLPWTRPWARVHIDGKDTGKVTPIAPSAKIELSPGPHKVTFVVGSTKHNFQVTIESGKTKKLSKILEP